MILKQFYQNKKIFHSYGLKYYLRFEMMNSNFSLSDFFVMFELFLLESHIIKTTHYFFCLNYNIHKCTCSTIATIYSTWPVAELFVLVCSTSKFICSSVDCVPRLLITENDISYKSNIYKSRMMWTSYQFKIEFIINTKSERQLSLRRKLNNNISFWRFTCKV